MSTLQQILGVVPKTLNTILGVPSKLEQLLGIGLKDVFMPKPAGGDLTEPDATHPIGEVTIKDNQVANERYITRNDYNKITNAPSTPTPTTPAKQPLNVNKALEVIRHQESRGEKTPYAFKRDSGDPAQGQALGAYQVTEGELKTYAQKYLGKIIGPKEFLANPKIQDTYMANKLQRLQNEFGFTIPEIFGAHRGGINGRNKPEYQLYRDEAVNLYNKT